jgi:hypothetical protein
MPLGSQGPNASSFIHMISSYAYDHGTLLLMTPPLPIVIVSAVRALESSISLTLFALCLPLATMAALPDHPAYQPNVLPRN